MAIKAPFLFCIISFILLLLTIDIATFDPEDLNSPYMFKDEICSYHGNVNIEKSNKTFITCSCKNDYSTYSVKVFKINGVNKQCQYVKKRRFTTLFLAVFVPFGMDHFYLGNYFYCIPILLLCCTTIIGNCIRFAFPSEESKKGYLYDNINIFFAVLIIICLVTWIINIALIITGVTKDGNNIETFDDLTFKWY